MNVRKEINRLESKNVFVHTGYEHYANGSNLLFSIEFRDHKKQTGWYNDNHEFGDGGDAIVAAIELSKWFLEDVDRITNIDTGFLNPKHKEKSEKVRSLMKGEGL